MDTSVNRRGTVADQGSCSLEKCCPSCRQRSQQRIRHRRWRTVSWSTSGYFQICCNL